MKLLIADDSLVVRSAIERSANLPEIDTILQAADGLRALEIFRQYRPEIVTLDLTMPGLEGLDCLAQIHEIDPQASILVISAINSHEISMEAVRRGACGFVIKPFTEVELREAVQDLVSHALQTRRSQAS
jgi:two-component system, chemotaxis family, chemotaxis protein CheY